MTDLGYLALTSAAASLISLLAGLTALFSRRWRRWSLLAFLAAWLSYRAAREWWFQIVF